MFNRIIVGVDGSPASVNAAKIALRIGNFLDVPVVGVYVIDTRLLEESFLADLAGMLGLTYYEGASAKVREFLEKQGDAVLTEFSALGREFGAKVSVVQTTGIPCREIADQADPEDLIVIGRIGEKPVKGTFPGATAERVARISKCPVLLMPKEERSIREVLVAYDGSEGAEFALRICVTLRDLFGYRLNLIYVGAEAEEVKRRADRLVGGDYRFYTASGFPEEQIVSLVREKDMDMLFMGAYGKSRFREFILGSVTSFVIYNLEVPLFLAKRIRG